ncbi:hypothetical protein [Paenibacillus sp. PAMC21692]|uniref:hypothetical protein n=1 Tax=Paenibacillus sp. PAMC21692 TaxID=2762320 RepID=UPI00164E40F8|nr:hypothetical protein [Paenibacillus sp. PAMC21692]QNK59612.1 hypothetical protein H7F31_12560 [Paenibacillus sp. PAMC21692]
MKTPSFIFFVSVVFVSVLTGFMYENPEPSDFYYLMSKVGGIVVMIGSIIVAFKAY